MAQPKSAKVNSICSMTGFARQDGSDDHFTWSWEVKSVNGKSLDLRFRLPPGFESLEGTARAMAGRRYARGSFQISLTVKTAKEAQRFQINRPLLDQLLALSEEIAGNRGREIAVPGLDGLLAIRGVVEISEEDEEPEAKAARNTALGRDLERAFDALAETRRIEGVRLTEAIDGHLASLAALVGEAADCAAAQPKALRERLRAQLEDLLAASPALPEERLAQEAAVLATKADVREELDRLAAHLSAARELLATGGPAGRRLDFLCQELNREANTLCAKSSDIGLTRIGIELKAVIDQLREQVQNLE